MSSPYLSPYEDPSVHAHVSALIRRHSSNRQDVREALLGTLDFTGAEEILDLGCGFGFWLEAMAGRVSPKARFTGIDACGSNERSYLRAVESSGRRARFIRADLVSELPFREGSFDLVIAAYSLYFFVGIIPEVARVLRHSGRFLAVTHSERSFAGLLCAMGLDRGDSPLLGLVRHFSSENGQAKLSSSFAHVERLDYENSLSFNPADRGDFLAYARFKLPLLSPGPVRSEGGEEALIEVALQRLKVSGQVVVEKDDTLFICRGRHGR